MDHEAEIRAYKSLLWDTDYIDHKIVEEGEPARIKYAEILAKRAEWRVKIRECEALLNV